MDKTLTIHRILRISDERAKEIAGEVHAEMSPQRLVAECIETVGTRYEIERYEETIYRGMCLATAVNMNRPKKQMVVATGAELN